MRRAKIVATIGPASSSYEVIEKLVRAGMNVARLNMSHGSRDDHELVYHRIRRAAAATGLAVGVLVDLQGPKIRVGRFTHGAVELVAGQPFTITAAEVGGTPSIVSTTYKSLAADVTAGDTILLDDGRIRLRVTATSGEEVHTTVSVGGTLSNNKGINLPGVAVSAPALTEKDADDLRWAVGIGADMVALSFVRSPKDALPVRRIMAEEGRRVPVIAKIEKPEAVTSLLAIVDAFDGVMVARGDLGVEMPLEGVPIVQKEAVSAARRWAKPVIVATQMLESMISGSVPTRAETSDVANAVLDGADAVMLSGETGVGAFPVQTVETMARIVSYTEQNALERIPPLGTKPRTQGGAMTLAAQTIADFVGAKYICVFSQSGDSAARMSRLRHRIPILAFTDLPSTRARMALAWGVEAFVVRRGESTDELMAIIDQTLLGSGAASAGDKVVVTAGAPPGIAGSTNNVRVHTIGAADGS